MIETSLPAQVELLCLTHRAPLLVQGTLDTRLDDSESWQFESASPIPMEVEGFRAIVNFKDESLPMLTLKITKHQDSKLILEPTQIHPREKRLFPRLFGIINLIFKANPSREELSGWLDGTLEADDSWITPVPLMNFSVNGASFHSPVSAPAKSTLLIELNFDKKFRGLARVVRCDEQDDQYEIAIYFEDIPDEAINHLTQLTLLIQDSLF